MRTKIIYKMLHLPRSFSSDRLMNTLTEMGEQNWILSATINTPSALRCYIFHKSVVVDSD